MLRTSLATLLHTPVEAHGRLHRAQTGVNLPSARPKTPAASHSCFSRALRLASAGDMADITDDLQDAEGEGEQDGPHGSMDTVEGNWDGKASHPSRGRAPLFASSFCRANHPPTFAPRAVQRGRGMRPAPHLPGGVAAAAAGGTGYASIRHKSPYRPQISSTTLHHCLPRPAVESRGRPRCTPDEHAMHPPVVCTPPTQKHGDRVGERMSSLQVADELDLGSRVCSLCWYKHTHLSWETHIRRRIDAAVPLRHTPAQPIVGVRMRLTWRHLSHRAIGQHLPNTVDTIVAACPPPPGV